MQSQAVHFPLGSIYTQGGELDGGVWFAHAAGKCIGDADDMCMVELFTMRWVASTRKGGAGR